MEKKINSGLKRIFLALLLLSIVGNIVSLTTNTNSNTDVGTDNLLLDTRVEAEKEIQLASSELEKYKGISNKLDSILEEAEEKIKLKDEKILELVSSISDFKKLETALRKEIDGLKELKATYLDQIDELLLANLELSSNNLALNKTINSLQGEILKLKGKVSTGEKLIADNIRVTPLKKKLTGKYGKTAMARKTKKIEVCFDVLENRLANADNHNVYLRIISPAGVIMYDLDAGSGSANNPELDVEMMYTLDHDFDYKNQKQLVCMMWDAPANYKAGTYIVELYTDKNKMGIASFILR